MPNRGLPRRRAFDRFKLKDIRAARGLTQETLARQAGLTTDGVQKIEQGLRQPRTDTLVLLADTLACRLDDLFSPR